MRGFPTILIPIVSTLLLAQAVSGVSISITQMPALYVTDYGAGITHTINNYNLTPDQAVSNGAWMLLATNDQSTFARIDARKDVAFSAWQTRQYDVANNESFRWYYLYLQDGFPVGSNLEFHLNELSPPPVPTPGLATGVDIVIERAPLVIIVDYNGEAVKVDHYTFTSSVTLANSQSWQLLGTNDPNILGSNNVGAFTVLDDQSGIGFTSGVPKEFTVTSPSDFLYYVVYLQSGFYLTGMNLEIHLSETPPVPTPTPTPTPAPTPRYYIRISGGGDGGIQVVPVTPPSTTTTSPGATITPGAKGTSAPMTGISTPTQPQPTPVGMSPLTIALGILLAIALFFRQRR